MCMEFNLVHMMIKRVKYWCLVGFFGLYIHAMLHNHEKQNRICSGENSAGSEI